MKEQYAEERRKKYEEHAKQNELMMIDRQARNARLESLEAELQLLRARMRHRTDDEEQNRRAIQKEFRARHDTDEEERRQSGGSGRNRTTDTGTK